MVTKYIAPKEINIFHLKLNVFFGIDSECMNQRQQHRSTFWASDYGNKFYSYYTSSAYWHEAGRDGRWRLRSPRDTQNIKESRKQFRFLTNLSAYIVIWYLVKAYFSLPDLKLLYIYFRVECHAPDSVFISVSDYFEADFHPRFLNFTKCTIYLRRRMLEHCSADEIEGFQWADTHAVNRILKMHRKSTQNE